MSKWTSSKTWHFTRFQTKRRSDSNSAYKNCVFQHWSKLILDIFWKTSDFETYNLKNSLKCSVSGLGNIKKQFLMVESCLEHISKLSLVRKTIFWDIYIPKKQKTWSRQFVFFKGWLETMPKDAPWCTDHFSYWMTTPRVIFGG